MVPHLKQMKKIGIVGGTAWPSTAQYYSELCRSSETRFGVTPEFEHRVLGHKPRGLVYWNVWRRNLVAKF